MLAPTTDNPGGQPSPLKTVNETCDYLRISRSLLYQLFDDGDLRKIKIGSRAFVHSADLDRYLGTSDPSGLATGQELAADRGLVTA